MLRITEAEQDLGWRLQAHHSAWATLVFAGEPAKCREHADAGRRLYDPEAHRTYRFVYSHDPGACARWTGALAEWLLGYPEKALASIAEALTFADRIAHPFSTMLALNFAFAVYLNCRESEAVMKRLETAEALAAEQRLPFPVGPEILRGAALVGLGAVDEAAVQIRRGLTEMQRRGATLFLPFGLAFLADALTRRGEPTEALAAAREGLELASATGEHVWDAELHRLAGVALLGCNRLDEVQSTFEEALRVARTQQAKSYELRTATSLARLWAEQGRRAEARELLGPVYGWFTEGFDTADLKEAKALLDQLKV